MLVIKTITHTQLTVTFPAKNWGPVIFLCQVSFLVSNVTKSSDFSITHLNNSMETTLSLDLKLWFSFKAYYHSWYFLPTITFFLFNYETEKIQWGRGTNTSLGARVTRRIWFVLMFSDDIMALWCNFLRTSETVPNCQKMQLDYIC